MTNLVQRDAIVNQVQILVPQSSLVESTTSDPLDLTDTKRPNHLLLIAAQDFTEVDKAFVTIQQSDGGVTWERLIDFPVAGTTIHSFTRTKRRIRAVVTVEEAEDATTPIVPMSLLLLS